MDKLWDIFLDFVAPLLVLILSVAIVVVIICGAIAIFEKPKSVDVEEVYSFSTKVVDNHNILVITRNSSLQFEAIDLGPVEAEKK
jgi:hypothetical protein